MTFQGVPVLALIPARGGSKSVKRKNLRVIRGKSLLAHAVDAARGANAVDCVYVSSEDPEIQAAATAMGVDVIRRADEAASDTATAAQVVSDFLGHLDESTLAADPYLVYLQPTSPLRTATHIDDAFAELAESRAEICLSVVELTKTPYKAFVLDLEGRLQALFGEEATNANRQELPRVYYPNGAIYIFPVSEFLQNGGFPSNGGIPYVMSEGDSIDIDTEDDLRLIEKLCP